MYSQTTIIGNLTKDISISYLTNGTSIGKSSIAYTDGYGDKKKTHFIDIVVWGKTSEIMNQYCKTGSKVLLVGVVEFQQWKAQDGTNRSKHALKVDTMKMLDSKSDNQNQTNNQQQPTNQVNHQQRVEPEIQYEDADETVPF